MRKKEYFTLNDDEIQEVSQTNDELMQQKSSLSADFIDNYYLKEEKEFYDELYKKIEFVVKYKDSFNVYAPKYYSNIDFNLLFEQLYFGSYCNIDNKTFYIGKQEFFDIKSQTLCVYDWRSSFGDTYYNLQTNQTSYVKYAREYYDKYNYRVIYPNVASNIQKLKKRFNNKKSGFLLDIISTIDEFQNEIIRSIENKVEVIVGGPGTGKTTIGLHILSFKIFNYLKQNSVYPKILIVVSNLKFKNYIEPILKSLDLSGKYYHRTNVLTYDEFLNCKETEFEYIFFDEFQDAVAFDVIYLLSKMKTENIVICVDNDQRINFDDLDDYNLIASSLSSQYRIRYLFNNYRNPEKLIYYSNQLVLDKQKSMIDKCSEFVASIIDINNLSDTMIIDYVQKEIVNGNVCLICDEKYKQKFKNYFSNYKGLTLLDEINFNLDNCLIILSPMEAKGLEFDSVIVYNDFVNFTERSKRELFVAVTRSLGNVLLLCDKITVFKDLKYVNLYINNIKYILDYLKYTNEINEYNCCFEFGDLDISIDNIYNLLINNQIDFQQLNIMVEHEFITIASLICLFEKLYINGKINILKNICLYYIDLINDNKDIDKYFEIILFIKNIFKQELFCKFVILQQFYSYAYKNKHIMLNDIISDYDYKIISMEFIFSLIKNEIISQSDFKQYYLKNKKSSFIKDFINRIFDEEVKQVFHKDLIIFIIFKEPLKTLLNNGLNWNDYTIDMIKLKLSQDWKNNKIKFRNLIEFLNEGKIIQKLLNDFIKENLGANDFELIYENSVDNNFKERFLKLYFNERWDEFFGKNSLKSIINSSNLDDVLIFLDNPIDYIYYLINMKIFDNASIEREMLCSNFSYQIELQIKEKFIKNPLLFSDYIKSIIKVKPIQFSCDLSNDELKYISLLIEHKIVDANYVYQNLKDKSNMLLALIKFVIKNNKYNLLIEKYHDIIDLSFNHESLSFGINIMIYLLQIYSLKEFLYIINKLDKEKVIVFLNYANDEIDTNIFDIFNKNNDINILKQLFQYFSESKKKLILRKLLKKLKVKKYLQLRKI